MPAIREKLYSLVSDHPEKVAIGLVCGFLAYRFSFLRESLWLDETMTYWVVTGSLPEAMHKGFFMQGPGLLYFLVVWCFVSVFGSSEVVLRAPSVISLLALAGVTTLLAKKIVGKQLAVFAVLILLSFSSVSTAGVDARPYALALCLVTVSVYFLVRWTSDGDKNARSYHAFFAVLAVYSHGIMLPIFLFYGLYHLILRLLRNDRLPLRSIILTYAVAGIFLSPALCQLFVIYQKRNIMSFAPAPTVADLFFTWVPWDILALLLAVILLRLASSKPRDIVALPKKEAVMLLLLWHLLPPLVLFIWSVLSGASVYSPRYFVWALPALAMLVALILSSVRFGAIRGVVVIVFIAVHLLYGAVHNPFPEDWAGSAKRVREMLSAKDVPVLAYTGFAESQDTLWVSSEEKQRYLRAPFAAYPLGKEPLLLPASFEQLGARDYLDQHVFPILSSTNSFILIQRITLLATNEEMVMRSDKYLEREFMAGGFHVSDSYEHGHLKVVLFKRTGKE